MMRRLIGTSFWALLMVLLALSPTMLALAHVTTVMPAVTYTPIPTLAPMPAISTTTMALHESGLLPIKASSVKSVELVQ